MSFTRNRSGEIVNATLMEVFVVLTFMFLIYATMIKDSFDTMVEQLKEDNIALEEKVAKREAERDKWKAKYENIFPPYCRGYGKGDYFGIMQILPGGKIRVQIIKPYKNVGFRGRKVLSPNEFKAQFAELRASTRKANCRLAVRVKTLTSELDEYRPALYQIREVFYTAGELR